MERSAVRQLDVFWGQVLVGRYRHCANGAESFEYDSGYLASSDATPISHSLPLPGKETAKLPTKSMNFAVSLNFTGESAILIAKLATKIVEFAV